MMQAFVEGVLNYAVRVSVMLWITSKSLAMKHTIGFEFPAGIFPFVIACRQGRCVSSVAGHSGRLVTGIVGSNTA
jgi:hypothetical protein